MLNWLRTLAWMGFAVVATYTAAEGTLAYKKTVEQDGTGYVDVSSGVAHDRQITAQQASDAASPIVKQNEITKADEGSPLYVDMVDVEAAYEATLRKHVDKHVAGVHRLDLEMQRIERHLKILHELKADNDRRLELVRQP